MQITDIKFRHVEQYGLSLIHIYFTVHAHRFHAGAYPEQQKKRKHPNPQQHRNNPQDHGHQCSLRFRLPAAGRRLHVQLFLCRRFRQGRIHSQFHLPAVFKWRQCGQFAQAADGKRPQE